MRQKRNILIKSLFLGSFALLLSCGSKKEVTYNEVDEVSEKLAEFKSAGWQIQGSSRTLRGVLTSVIDRKYSVKAVL